MSGSRVLFVLDSLGSGGAQRQAVLLFKGLLQKGYDCRILVYQPGAHYLSWLSAEEKERVVQVPKGKGLKGLFFPLALNRAIGRLNPAVVVSFLRGPSILVGLGRLLGKSPWRWLVSERSSRLALDSFLRRKLYAWAMGRCALVLPNSYTAKKEILALGIPEERVRVMVNGIVLEPSAPPKAPPGNKAGEKSLLMVGSVQALKNHLLVMETLLRVAPGGGWHLHHCGRPQDPVLAGKMKALADANPGRFSLHGEIFPLKDFYRRADVLVLPSAYEGFPNVLLEAWAENCPVLVSDRCDLPHLVSHGENGFIFSLDKEGELDEALSSILGQSPGTLRELGAAGRREVESRFALDVVLDQWVEVLDGP